MINDDGVRNKIKVPGYILISQADSHEGHFVLIALMLAEIFRDFKQSRWSTLHGVGTLLKTIDPFRECTP